MNKLYIRKNIVNNTFTIKLDDSNIDEVYKALPNIIKVLNKKYYVELFYNNKKINNDKYIKKYNIKNDKLIDIIEVVTTINIKDLRKKYEYIYDTVCKKLDTRTSCNYCKFKNNVCIKYKNLGINHENGCCENKGRGRCPYLTSNGCSIKCFACKLFTCKTLRKMGIGQNINDFTLTKYFLTSKQKDILQFNYWTPKDIVIDRILNKKTIRNVYKNDGENIKIITKRL